MATRQRNSDRLSLQVAKPSDGDAGGSRLPFGGLVPTWTVGAITTALGVAAGGWLLVAIWALVGWGTEMKGGVSAVFIFATRVWLAGNGTGLRIGSTFMTVIPLGLTLLNMVSLAAGCFFAARTGRAEPDDDEPPAPRSVVTATVLATVATYCAAVIVLAAIFTDPQQLIRGVGFTVVTAGLASLVGACLALKWDPLARLAPAAVWGGRAVGVGLAVLMLLAVTVLIAAVWTHWGRIEALSAALDLPAAAATIVILGELAFLPNMVLWAGSYALGGGVSVGTGTAVTITSTDLGLLPSFPIFGALPQSGPAEPGQILWLVGGLLAGAAAGLYAVRAWWAERDEPRVEWAAIVGGGAGVTTAVCWVVLAAASRGDLGSQRLVGIGPRLGELLGFSVGILGLAGALAGAAYALWATRSVDLDDADEDDGGDVAAGTRESSQRTAGAKEPSDTRRASGADDDLDEPGEPTQAMEFTDEDSDPSPA